MKISKYKTKYKGYRVSAYKLRSGYFKFYFEKPQENIFIRKYNNIDNMDNFINVVRKVL